MDPQVAELQRKLQAAGLYDGPIDGVSGPKTLEAAAKFQHMEQQRQTQELQTQQAQAEAARAEAEAQKSVAENDPTNRLTKMATELGPYAAGIGTGTAIGHYGFGKPYSKADAAQTKAASRLAQALDVSPEAKQAQLNKMGRGRMARNVGQFAAPTLLGGAGYATRNYIAPMFEDEQAQDIVRSVGAGENAAALGLGTHQLVDTLRRGNPIDPVDEARIRSGPVAPPPPPPPPPPADLPPPSAPAGPNPGTKAHLVAQAKDLGLKGTSRMTKSQLADALANAVTEHGGKRTVGKRVKDAVKGKAGAVLAPLLAGGIAFDATMSDAAAGDGEVSNSELAKALAVGGGTAGATGGGIYGMSKLAQMLPEGVRQFGGKALNAMAAPMAATDITSELAQKYMPREGQPGPSLSDFAGIAGDAANKIFMGQSDQDDRARQIKQMAQVPGRNPMFSDPPPAAPVPPELAQDQQLPGMVHQGEPSAPAPQMPNFGAGIDRRLQRMISMGAQPEQIAQFLNQSIR